MSPQYKSVKRRCTMINIQVIRTLALILAEIIKFYLAILWVVTLNMVHLSLDMKM